MLRATFLLVIGAVLISASAHGESGTNLQPTAAPVSLQQAISRCLSAPPGPAKVRIAFVLKPDGTVDGAPRILDGADDPHGRTFALAAIRAILRCMPYGGGLSGEVVATFSQSAD